MWGRIYFAAQALAGAVWWLGVFLLPGVRVTTLGSLDPVLVALIDIPLFVIASALAALGIRWAVAAATGWTVLVTLALALYATVSTQAGWGVVLMIAAATGSVVAACLTLLGRIPTAWIAIGPFRFRPADARAPRSRHLAATAAEIAVFWAVFLGVLPLLVAVVERRWQLSAPFGSLPLGVVLFALGGAVGIWSAAVMSSLGGGTPLPAAMPNRLVIAGPYRVVRNPMAVGSILQGIAVGILWSSWLVVAYAIAGAVLWHVVVRPEEEADLEARFGDTFRRYRGAVRCWWPRIRPVSGSG
jgi:protein-S-isoprenylcysteine O-methyltransferase Ste14